MAWIDDRIWCHGKFADLTDHAFAAYVKAVAYSSGMNCRGHLSLGQQRLIGCDTKARRELINAGLWDTNGDATSIYIHDWDEHNSKRDDRREADRVRKRAARKSQGTSAGQRADSPQDAPQDTTRTNATASTARPHVDGSEGSEGSDRKDQNPVTRTVVGDDGDGSGGDHLGQLLSKATPEDIPF